MPYQRDYDGLGPRAKLRAPWSWPARSLNFGRADSPVLAVLREARAVARKEGITSGIGKGQ